MAVNITQKDETLHKVIRTVCDLRDAKACKPSYKVTESDRAYMRACDDVIDACERMLGYSSPDMPLEVPNQSETTTNLTSAALMAARRATL